MTIVVLMITTCSIMKVIIVAKEDRLVVDLAMVVLVKALMVPKEDKDSVCDSL